ncbi:MAG TPA: zinc metalloprotease HtpX [Gammaproteobacteria bacterium]|nr:zinc metalloprotease HtpX [Gammaproteobacteria bacterium]
MSKAIINWREQLRSNQRKTRYVLVAFFCLYLLTGLILDIVFNFAYFSDYYTFSNFIIYYLQSIIHGHEIPYVTLFMSMSAIFSIIYTIRRANKIMLSGTEFYEVSSENKLELKEKQLLNLVEEMKLAASLPYMPKVYIIKTPILNAFASGWNEKSSMIAVTSGLMSTLNRNELQAVIAHELSHIKHQDTKLTVTTTILASLLTLIIDRMLRIFYYSGGSRRRSNNLFPFILLLLLRFTVPIITALLLSFLSRVREFMADSGAVKLTRNNQALGDALKKICNSNQTPEAKDYYHETQHESLRHESYIFDPKHAGIRKPNFTSLFSTHPSLKKRLSAIGIAPLEDKK